MAHVEIDQAAIRALYEEIAEKIKRVDADLRTALAGQPIEVVVPEAATKLAAIGVTLPSHSLNAYAESITKKVDFQFNLS